MFAQEEKMELQATIGNTKQSIEDKTIILPVSYVSCMPNFVLNSRDTINAFLNLIQGNVSTKNKQPTKKRCDQKLW